MLKVGIVGATGYGGEELIRLLLSHPEVEITVLAAKMEGEKLSISEIFPAFEGKIDLPCSDLDIEKMAADSELVFLALPHKVSMEMAARFLSLGKKVIDFSADYRFNEAQIYEEWYEVKHTRKELLKEAVYGLPELNREEIKQARLIANPGCYPTSVILGAAPLVSRGLVDPENIIADSKTGVSGAGRWPGKGFHFGEIQENFKAYKVAGHRHQPEMEEQLGRLAREKTRITFTPHLAPMKRGILSTIYMNLKKKESPEELRQIYKDFYEDEPFVRITEPDKFPETKDVWGSNYCHIGFKVDERAGRAIVISAIDNLIKGASGQAVQNMNIMWGFEEDEGLDHLGPRP
ncbi:MAG: N-acetyl-gamma-glutamyl-phosphate reductase [Nitrospirae bacterium]|nr:N-acetyl-gamma-glutamyl-phosphate reductase [Nitrospirota bacterium]